MPVGRIGAVEDYAAILPENGVLSQASLALQSFSYGLPQGFEPLSCKFIKFSHRASFSPGL